MTEKQTEKKGVCRFGFVTNLSTFLKEFNDLLEETEVKLRAWEINAIVDKSIDDLKIEYRTKFGQACQLETSLYAIFKFGKKGKQAEEIIGYYEKDRSGRWIGISFSDESTFKQVVKDKLMFRIGDLKFDIWYDGLQFLEDVKSKCIPEKWTYQNHKSSIPHPVLKSYIENIFQKLLIEDNGNKILKSDNGAMIIFNTGLLDFYFHEIYIIVSVQNENEEIEYINPYIYSGLEDLKDFYINGRRLNTKSLPQPAQFFNNINDVIFHDDIEIDRSPDKFNHIIDDRRDRFPEEFKESDTTTLAIRLDSAINQAIALAKRNYKLIVPMYRPQEDKIQLLMPIYLSGKFSNKPDFALVLNMEDGYYVPETILPLDAAYQNARLIAKPDNTWLNPEDI